MPSKPSAWKRWDYLLKPVDSERLEVTIERARRAVQERGKLPAGEQPAAAGEIRSGPQRTKLLVKSGSRNFIVDAADVIYADHRGTA